MKAILVFTLIIVLTLLTDSMPGRAAESVVTFDEPEDSVLYHALLKEYRCLKCQNQNLADSNAGLAGDLRREIHDQILAGKDKNDIDEYLVARYGEFVLYRPRFSARTAVLWIGPFVLLLVGLMALVYMVRGRRGTAQQDTRSVAMAKPDQQQSQQEKLEKARRLLSD